MCTGVTSTDAGRCTPRARTSKHTSGHTQARSLTGVHGKAASGALHEAMNSPDTSGSTLEQSHLNAVTATGVSPVLTTWRCT